MGFDKSYLEDEVREGFYVPAIMKQCWASQLTVLEEVDKLCERHQIQYFAEWGSLLGAVRHGGFIPWDDDLDIVMKRDDYEKFMRFHGELPKGFEVQTYRNREGYIQFITNVVGKSRICFEPEHYEKFKGFPYISGLDIFILDYISPDEEQEQKRCKEALFVIAAADAIADGQISADAALKQIRRVEEISGEKVDTRLSGHALRANMYEIAERMMGKFAKNEASELSQLMPWGLKNAEARMPKKYYEEQLRIPFEYMAIPVPTAYDDILKRRYGNYMRVVKGAAGHDYPCFRTQMESMRQTLMEDAPEMVDVMMPTFTYEQRAARGEGAGFKKLLSDALCEMWRMFDCIIADGGNVVGGNVRGIDGNEATIGHDEENGNGSGCENSGESDALSILSDMQQLAVDMGTLIEEVKGEGTECVKSLEALCDSIYILFEEINGSSGVAICEVSDKVNALKNSISETEKLIKQQILERRTVLFLPYKSDYWHSMETYWKMEKGKADTDVIVAPIPYFYKDFYGRLTDEQYSVSGYPQEVEVTAYEKLAIELSHPDVIYIQYPYDSYNPVTGILPEHYSSRLVEYTDELIYVPWFSLEKFTKTDMPEYHNMQYYALVPGVVNADRVLIHKKDSWIKSLYVDKLTEWAGEGTRTEWNEKIVIDESETEDESDVVDEAEQKHVGGISGENGAVDKDEIGCEAELPGREGRKKILYYIGMGQFLEFEEKMISKIVHSFSIFEEHSNKIEVLLAIDPTIDKELPRLRPELWDKLGRLIGELSSNSWCQVVDNDIESFRKIAATCDAFYGDQGYLMRWAQREGKPVMVQDILC